MSRKNNRTRGILIEIPTALVEALATYTESSQWEESRTVTAAIALFLMQDSNTGFGHSRSVARIYLDALFLDAPSLGCSAEEGKITADRSKA